MTVASAGNENRLSRLKTLFTPARGKRFLAWAAALLTLFGLFGYFAGPPLLKSVLVKQLSQELHREVSIAAVAINPYALSARIEGLAVRAADGHEVAGFDALRVDLSWASLAKRALVIDAIRLEGPRLAVAHEGGGRYDVSDLIDAWSQPNETPSALPRFSLNNIELVGGHIVFDDQPKAVRHEISDINLALPFLSSLPYQAEILVEPHFSARVDGSLIELKGRSTPFAGQRASELDLSIADFHLAGLQAYLPESLPLRIHGGKLDAHLKFVFKEVSAELFSLAALGDATVSGLALQEGDGRPLLAWKTLAVELDETDLINRRIAIHRLALDGPEVDLRVNRQGELNFLALLHKGAGEPPAAPAPTADQPALTWSLGEFALTDGVLRWRDESATPPVAGELRHVQARVGHVDSRLTEPVEIAEIGGQIDFGERFRAPRLNARGLRIDLPARRIDIAEISNGGSQLRLARDAQGAIEWIRPPVLKTAPAAPAEADSGPPWVARVARLAVDDLALRFEDRGATPAAVQELSGLRLSGENLGNESGSQGRLDIEGRLNQHGSLKIGGSVQLAPLDLKLAVDTRAIPLLPLQAYFAELLDVELKAGHFSNKGEASIRLDDGVLKVGYRGSATLGDLRAVDKVNQTDFLRWKSLHFGAIDFHLDPLAIGVGEIALSDFFARVILSESGRLNLQDIIRARETTPAPAAEPAKPVPIHIAKVTLQNGSINFTDHFIKPNYVVNVTQLGGRLTGLSSADGTVADLDLRGAYAKSAPVLIQGRLNPLAAKSYLDLKASVKGVDLTGFSPYSGKYAGYAIEKGQLSLDLAYKLENNQLTADNKVFIDQFTFGQPVDSPDATKLPVNLAIALLKNNRGEIDLHLPISGSLDDPQFSVGGVIVRVIGNLFVKAVTSPFALLGSMFGGGGEELSHLEFTPGRARIGDAQSKTLETLVKALTEREGLKLEITGFTDPEADREGLKQAALERAVRQEWRQAKAGDEKANARDDASLREILSAEDYATYLKRAYQAEKFPKPRNMIGFPKDLPVEEMEKLILANIPVEDDDLRHLARRRAENVRAWLIEHGQIAPERLFLVPPKDAAEPGTRVGFSLR